MEELYAVCSQPPADDHDQTELHYGGGASDRSDPAGEADRKPRKKLSQCVLSMCDHDTYGDSPAVSVLRNLYRDECHGGGDRDRHRLCQSMEQLF